ncbi:MAG: trypsin-like peptidase domain-containing protein [Actinobacteria bacterium]|nr:trypsin-like peptidase domain-containing protein [Actinomycetota bacterium]
MSEESSFDDKSRGAATSGGPGGADDHHTEVIPNPYATVAAPSSGQTSVPPGLPPTPPVVGGPYLTNPSGGVSSPTTPARSGGMGKVVAVAAAAGLLLGGVGGYAGYTLAANTVEVNDTTTAGSTSISIPAENLSPRAGDSIADIADRMLPTVVSIEEQGAGGTGTGSGFIIREDGYIVTNNHVVEGAADSGTLTVQFDDGTTKAAEIVGRNPAYDLAVIKVEADGLPVASIGNSDSIEVGDTVVALGSPLGLAGTVTSGIVSATDRPVTAGGQGETSYINAVQTDAAINPGNSGGPLVNAAAEVVGVNSAIASLGSDFSGQAGSIGLGFAIPSNTMKRIVEEIIDTGQAATPVIGVNLSPESDAQGGATVGSVVPGGPADDAGIAAGDVITAVNGIPANDSVTLITQIRSYAPGDEVTLTVDSGSGTREVKVTLGSKTD